MRAGIYVRISRDVGGEGLGVARQEEDCEALAERLGWEAVETYIDNDISATSGKTRPAYTKLLADLDSGHIEAIVAWHPDRLYRRAVDLGGLVDACKRNDARVATVNAGEVDLTSPTGCSWPTCSPLSRCTKCATSRNAGHDHGARAAS